MARMTKAELEAEQSAAGSAELAVPGKEGGEGTEHNADDAVVEEEKEEVCGGGREVRCVVPMPNIRHEFAERVGKSWEGAEWHERLPYHTPRDFHRHTRQEQALAAARRLATRQARLASADLDGSTVALTSTPRPPARRMTPGQRHLLQATEALARPMRGSPNGDRAAAASLCPPLEQHGLPWTSPHSATGRALLSVRPLTAAPVVHTDPQPRLATAPGPQTVPTTTPVQAGRPGTTSYGHGGRKVLKAWMPKAQSIRQLPLTGGGRTDAAPGASGPHSGWRSARSDAVFSARRRASAHSLAADIAAVVAQASLSASVSAPESATGAADVDGGRSSPSNRPLLDRRRLSDRTGDTATASAALRGLRSRIGPEIRDRPAKGWAAQYISPSGRHGPPRCAPLSPGQEEGVHVSVSRTERMYAETQTVLAEAAMDRKMLKMQLELLQTMNV